MQRMVMVNDLQPEHRAPIDLSILDENTGQQRCLQKEVIDLYLQQAAHKVRELKEAEDAKTWSEAAHALKGGARNIGAQKLADLADRAEDMPFEAGTCDCVRVVRLVAAELHAVRAHHKDLFEKGYYAD